MRRDFHHCSALACQDVVRAIVFSVEHLGSDQAADKSVVVDLLEAGTALVLVISLVDDVEAGATSVLLASSINLSAYNNAVLFELIFLVHTVEASLLTLEALFSKIQNLRLLLVDDTGTDDLIRFTEILFKSSVLVDVVG